MGSAGGGLDDIDGLGRADVPEADGLILGAGDELRPSPGVETEDRG